MKWTVARHALLAKVHKSVGIGTTQQSAANFLYEKTTPKTPYNHQTFVRKRISVYKNSNIRGYFITYPWIFHYVTADISLNIRGYLSFCVRGNWKLREELMNFREVCWSFPKGVIPTEHSDEGSLRDFFAMSSS